MPLFENNLSPYLTIVEATEPAAPSAGQQRLYIDSTTHLLKATNSSGTDRNIESNGNYTSSVPWSSGTSMPGAPATNQRVTRTDLGLDFYYDGTRWVTVELFHEPFQGATSNGIVGSPATVGYLPMWHTDFDLWVDSIHATTYVVATNNGSLFWTVQYSKNTNAAAQTSIGSFNTSADTQANYVTHKVAVGAAVVQPTNKVIDVTVTKTSTPGALYVFSTLVYRLIGV